MLFHFSKTKLIFIYVGSSGTAQLLLDLEAPVGVFDNEGISCISHLIEKMQNVAYQALNQFIVTKLGRTEIYLGYLENDPNSKKLPLTRGPLEVNFIKSLMAI